MIQRFKDKLIARLDAEIKRRAEIVLYRQPNDTSAQDNYERGYIKALRDVAEEFMPDAEKDVNEG